MTLLLLLLMNTELSQGAVGVVQAAAVGSWSYVQLNIVLRVL
jgi:hypothetical protein